MNPEPQDPAAWHVYVLLCSDNSYYCGITTDLQRRIQQHNAGRGARYTCARRPVQMLVCWPCASQSEALQQEHHFKSLSRPRKNARLATLLSSNPIQPDPCSENPPTPPPDSSPSLAHP
jgi:putative endonuclease